MIDRRIVDQDVDWPVALQSCNRGLNGVSIGDIERRDIGGGFARKLGGRSFELAVIAAVEDDGSARLRKPARDSQAEAGAAARDQRAASR